MAGSGASCPVAAAAAQGVPLPSPPSHQPPSCHPALVSGTAPHTAEGVPDLPVEKHGARMKPQHSLGASATQRKIRLCLRPQGPAAGTRDAPHPTPVLGHGIEVPGLPPPRYSSIYPVLPDSANCANTAGTLGPTSAYCT